MKDTRYEGKRIYILDNFRTFHNPHNTIRKISWITEDGDIQEYAFYDQLEGRITIHDAQNVEHTYDINESYDFLPQRRNLWENTIYLPFPTLIRELKEGSKRISKGIAKLRDEGLPGILRYLLEQGAYVEQFHMSMCTREDEKGVCLRIQIPGKEVKAHLHSDQPMLNKSMVARRPVLEEVAAALNGQYHLVLDESKYIYFFERDFSFDQLFYILQDEHLEEILHLINTINRAFWYED